MKVLRLNSSAPAVDSTARTLTIGVIRPPRESSSTQLAHRDLTSPILWPVIVLARGGHFVGQRYAALGQAAELAALGTRPPTCC